MLSLTIILVSLLSNTSADCVEKKFASFATTIEGHRNEQVIRESWVLCHTDKVGGVDHHSSL